MIARQTQKTKRWAEYPALLVAAAIAGLFCFLFAGSNMSSASRSQFMPGSDSILYNESPTAIGVRNIFPVREFFSIRPQKRQH